VDVTLGVLVELPDAVRLLLGDSEGVEVPVFVTEDVCKRGEVGLNESTNHNDAKSCHETITAIDSSGTSIQCMVRTARR
jgi:hypothetical protein